MLTVERLTVSYGHIDALKGVSLVVGHGEFVGVIGPNGAGKTTLLLALSGAVPVRAGRILFDGEDLTDAPQHLRVSRGVAIVPEGRSQRSARVSAQSPVHCPGLFAGILAPITERNSSTERGVSSSAGPMPPSPVSPWQ